MSFNGITKLLPRSLLAALCLSALPQVVLAVAEDNVRVSTQSSEMALEEVLVTGKRPGPPLWRVSNGTSTLWIFGVLDPLPKRLVWDPASVNAIMQDSKAYLAPPGVSASVSNPLRVIGILRALSKLKKLAKGEQLKDVVPAKLYREFTDVAAQFRLANRRTKKLRPMFAAEALTEQALSRSGLRDSEQLQTQIERIVKRHKVPKLTHTRHIAIDSALEILASPNLESELACLQTTVESVSTDLQQAKIRAQAWAEGNAALLSAMDYPDVDSSCVVSLFSSPAAVTLQTEANQAWLASAVQVLKAHETSFASLPMRELVHQDGLLKQLEQLGYQVRGQ